nr:MAG TPA: hypothetical protein [Bacteriophage sp.]
MNIQTKSTLYISNRLTKQSGSKEKLNYTNI